MDSEQWAVSSEQWAVSSEQWAVDGDVEIRDVRVTNVTDRSFTVVWETDRPAPVWVRFGTGKVGRDAISPYGLEGMVYDDRGADVVARTHHVTVVGLSPGTAYSFVVVSGATTDDNGGQLYQVTTGPTLSIPAVQTVYGRVLQTDGKTAAGMLVRLVLTACPEPCRRDSDGEGSPGQSAPLSAVTDAQGYWMVNLSAARTLAGDAYFAATATDRLGMTAWHPLLGRAIEEVQLGDLPAGLPLELTVTPIEPAETW